MLTISAPALELRKNCTSTWKVNFARNHRVVLYLQWSPGNGAGVGRAASHTLKALGTRSEGEGNGLR